MELYLRVIADTDDTVIREVRIKGSATLLELHENLYPAFGLLPGEMAAFFYSTANWDQGDQLPMFAMEDEEPSMENTTVEEFFRTSSHGLYVYNFLDMNIFYVEKTRVFEEEGFEPFVLVSSVGHLPETKKPTADPMSLPGAGSKDPSEMSPEELDAFYGLDSFDEENGEDWDNEDDFDPYSDEY